MKRHDNSHVVHAEKPFKNTPLYGPIEKMAGAKLAQSSISSYHWTEQLNHITRKSMAVEGAPMPRILCVKLPWEANRKILAALRSWSGEGVFLHVFASCSVDSAPFSTWWKIWVRPQFFLPDRRYCFFPPHGFDAEKKIPNSIHNNNKSRNMNIC